MPTITIRVEENRRVHTGEYGCGLSSNTVTARHDVDPEDILIERDSHNETRITVPDVIHRSRMCPHCWSQLRRACEDANISLTTGRKTKDTVAFTDQQPGSVTSEFRNIGDKLHEPANGTVTPIITVPSATRQIEAARIDRRPVITVDDRRKYSDIKLDVTPTAYQLTPDGVESLADIAVTHRNAALETGEQREDVPITINSGTSESGIRRRRRILTVENLLLEQVHTIAVEWANHFADEELLAVFDEENTHSPLPESEQPTEHDTGDPGPIPRPGAPTPSQDTVTGLDLDTNPPLRHAPLQDKQPDADEIREYISPKMYRVARHIEPGVTVTEQPDNGAITGEDTVNGYTATVWFNDGAPVRHECGCPTTADPCEHVTAVLRNLPDLSPALLG